MPRGRPRGDANRIKRLRAFELYATGHKKAEIARTLGVTKAAVTGWSKNDVWDDRLASLATRAQEAADHAIGETITDIVLRIRAKYDQRLKELDLLCTSSLTPPQAKISAIKAWFELGQKVQPDALRPASDPRNLELIQDLLPADSTLGRPVQDLLPGVPDSGSKVPPTSGSLSSNHALEEIQTSARNSLGWAAPVPADPSPSGQPAD